MSPIAFAIARGGARSIRVRSETRDIFVRDAAKYTRHFGRFVNTSRDIMYSSDIANTPGRAVLLSVPLIADLWISRRRVANAIRIHARRR